MVNMKRTIVLTEKQALEIYEMLENGLHHYCTWFLHDGWEEGYSKQDIKNSLGRKKRFIKAITLMYKKIMKGLS